MDPKSPDSTAPSPGEAAPKGRNFAKLKWAWLVMPFAYLWFRLINNLRVEWETNPQYSYGYIVPFLCLGLLLHRWAAQGKAETGKQKVETGAGQAVLAKVESRSEAPLPTSAQSNVLPVSSNFSFQPSVFQLFQPRPFSAFCFLLFILFSFLYLPTRLIELATPEWRLIQWAMGVIAIGLTLLGILLGFGRGWLRALVFPICFFLVAIPWPTFIEQPIIQSLTRINAALVIEVMGIIGVPALQHGNVIEVGTGVVGIDEACSGIRSFQSSIMISLFLGALYDLPRWRRILFIPIGFLLAMIFNLGRTSFLTYVAAKEGVSAIDKYHDPAGLWILVGCTIGLWLVGLLLKKRAPKPSALNPHPTSAPAASPSTVVTSPSSIFYLPSSLLRFSIGLLVWLLCVELGSHAWYRSREARAPKSPEWAMTFPTNNANFKDLPMAPATYNLLRFDDGKQGAWTEPDGTTWQAFYFNWHPGRVAGYLAKRHTPEACLPATGRLMLSGPELMLVKLHGLELPVRRYRFGPDGNSLHVYHCRWESGAAPGSFVQWESSSFNLVRGIWAGRGNQGQKVIEVIISGTEDPEAAKALLIQRLGEMIKVEALSAQEAVVK